MEQKTRVIKTDEEFKVLADPYRLDILTKYIESHEPLTVKQVADLLGEVPAKVHYHVKKLIAINILELDHTKVINGITAKYYKATADNISFGLREELDDVAKSLQLDQITKVLVHSIDNFKKDVINSQNLYKERNFKNDENKGSLSNLDLYLDQEDIKELREFLEKFLKEHTKQVEGKDKYASIFGLISKE